MNVPPCADLPTLVQCLRDKISDDKNIRQGPLWLGSWEFTSKSATACTLGKFIEISGSTEFCDKTWSDQFFEKSAKQSHDLLDQNRVKNQPLRRKRWRFLT